MKLVGVSVAVELAGDGVGVAGDDCVEVGTPNSHTVHMAGRDVTQDVNLSKVYWMKKKQLINLFALQLCQLKFKDEP